MVSDWNGDGVFVRGESPTHHTNQMKLFNIITACAAIFLIIPPNANAKTCNYGFEFADGQDKVCVTIDVLKAEQENFERFVNSRSK